MEKSKEKSEQDIRTKEQKDMDFYKTYFGVKTGKIDGYIYTQDRDGSIKIETENKNISDEYYVQ